MRRVTSFLFLLCWYQIAIAWWATPHLLSAEIAYQNLHPDVRNKVDLILDEDFVEASTYADQIRKQGNHRYNTWHYVTLTFQQPNDPMPELPGGENIVWAIAFEQDNLQDPQSLKRLIHWVADLHQPLHATTHIAPQYPQGDKGGNRFKIDMPKAYNNLHAYWDSGLLQWPYLPQPLSEKDKKRLQSMAKSLQAAYSPVADSGNPSCWARQNHLLGRQAYQDIVYGEKPSEQYVAWGREVSRQQVTQAGYRLADLLNKKFADK
jgi:hypothetical protein